MADLARQRVILVIKDLAQNLDQRQVAAPLDGPVKGIPVLRDDLILTRDQLTKRFALAPGVLPAFHRLCLVVDLVLVGDRLLEEVRVSLGEANPLGLALEEAEVTAGARPPLVVVR